ncbi:MAG: cysteine--tRNA ligase [Pseudomonadota bacterium]
MGLKIYDSLTRKKQDFVPGEPGKVGMYVCGVTVYDMCHIGHARSIVLFDVIYRYLMSKGYDVTYVRNFTDVDDKIINRANDLNEDWKSLAERFITEFHVDMDGLGVLRPTHEPRATEHIGRIQSLVERLIATGNAYEVEGDVMFSVESFHGYGKLSGKKIDDLISGARVQVDEKKRNPLDFALWKGAKPGEPSWPSPWGPGRPGWHIECSAMSTEYLGEGFDIHGGGADLAFPHHENEIAQSEAASGTRFAKYWIHNGFVNIRSEKMSKSLGNVLNIRDILKRVHPEALRLFLLSSHYRSPLDYNETSIREASAGLERLYTAMAAMKELIRGDGTGEDLPEELTHIAERFSEAMDDDFNTPKTLAILFDAARAINRVASLANGPRDALTAAGTLAGINEEILGLSRQVLGLLNEDAERFIAARRRSGADDLEIGEEEILGLIDRRAQARKEKRFADADKIRDELLAKGIVLEDGPKGTVWKVKE